MSPLSLSVLHSVNSVSLAKERGLSLAQVTTEEHADYVSTIGVQLCGADGEVEVVGTVFGKRDLRIVRIDSFEIDAVPKGTILVIRNDDVPRIVGRIGTILGEADINIARIHLSREARHGQAFSMISIDSHVPDDILEKLQAIKHVRSIQPISL